MSETTPENVTAERLAKTMWESQHPISFYNIDAKTRDQFTQMARVAIAKLRPAPAPAAPPVPVLTVEEKLARELIGQSISGEGLAISCGNGERITTQHSVSLLPNVHAHFAAQITAITGPLREGIERLKGEKASKDVVEENVRLLRINRARMDTIDRQSDRIAVLQGEVEALQAAQAKPAEPSPEPVDTALGLAASGASLGPCPPVAVDGRSAGERVLSHSWTNSAIVDAVNAEVAAAVAAERETGHRAFALKLDAAVAARDAEIRRLKGENVRMNAEIAEAKRLATEAEANYEGLATNWLTDALHRIKLWHGPIKIAGDAAVLAAADAGTGGVKA